MSSNQNLPIPFPTGNALPTDQADYLKSIYQNYANDYNKPAFADVHPVQAAAYGFSTYGLPGIFAAGRISRDKRDKRQQADLEGWQNAYKQALTNQENINKDSGPRNFTEGRQTQQDALRAAGYIGNETPDLYPRSLPPMDGTDWTPTRAPYMDPAQTNDLFKSAAGGSDIQALANNLPGFTKMGMGVTNYQNAGKGELQGTVGSYTPSLPPVIVDPGALQTQLATGYQAGLGQGTERYKFNQEAPKRLAEVQKLILEGKTEQAKALLTGAQAKTEQRRPGLISAQTSNEYAGAKLKNRTDPNIRSGGSAPDPLLGIGRIQGILQNQKQAVLSQMEQNGFIDRKTGQILPPAVEAQSNGFFGLGAHPSNAAKVQQYNALRQQLDSIDGQLINGAGTSSATAPAQLQRSNPSSRSSASGDTIEGKHGKYKI